MQQKQRAFTLVELLITMAIMGILLSISVLALGSSRAKSRDAKRVADVQVIRAALEQYWLTQASYPAVASFTNLSTKSTAFDVISSNGFEATPGSGTVYLLIPTGPNTGEYYQYQSTVSTGYSIKFITETTTNYGGPGTYYAHSNIVDTDSSSK